MFSDSVLSWQNEPMVIQMGDTGVPVRSLNFPAVTVCSDEEADTIDRWYFTEAILNIIDRECRKGK